MPNKKGKKSGWSEPKITKSKPKTAKVSPPKRTPMKKATTTGRGEMMSRAEQQRSAMADTRRRQQTNRASTRLTMAQRLTVKQRDAQQRQTEMRNSAVAKRSRERMRFQGR